MNDKRTIFYVGSDRDAVLAVKENLENSGVTFLWGDDGAASFPRIFRESPGMVMVDITDTDRTGFDVCRELREEYDGLILVTMNRNDDMDQVLAFALGADEVVVKPVSARLLLAHINALFRREERTRQSAPRSITMGDFKINAARREAYINDQHLQLTTLQFDLLWFLVKNAGSVVSRDDICHALFNSEYNGVDRSIDVYISRLRQKIGDDPSNPYYLKTVRGEGYLFAQE